MIVDTMIVIVHVAISDFKLSIFTLFTVFRYSSLVVGGHFFFHYERER